MSITRGNFLKSLGKSLPGMLLGSGAAAAAKNLLGKMDAVTRGPAVPLPGTTGAKPADAEALVPEIIYNGPAVGNRVALTFDDGPTPGITERILDELKQRGLHATFFMIGQKVAAAPDLARRVLAEGHVVANHTYTHPKLTELSAAQAAAEIQKTQDLFAQILGHTPAWFRPPYGFLGQNQIHFVQSRGLRVVMWNVDPRDWAQPGEDQVAATIFRETQPGAIILCHDMYAQTANAVAPILDGLLQRGFAPVTLSELMAA